MIYIYILYIYDIFIIYIYIYIYIYINIYNIIATGEFPWILRPPSGVLGSLSEIFMLQFSSLINWRNLQGEINHSLLVNSQQSSLTIFFGEIDEILFLLAISCSPGSSGCINRAEIVTETRNFSESLKGFCWDPCSFLSPRFEFHASGKIGHFRELDAFFSGSPEAKNATVHPKEETWNPNIRFGRLLS